MPDYNRPLDDPLPPRTNNNEALRSWLLVPLAITFGSIILGSLFKILHWEYADLLLLIGLIGFPAVVLVRFLLMNEKTVLGYVWTFFLITWSITALFVIFHWEGANQLLRLRSVAFYGLLVVSAVTVVSRLRKGEITLSQIIGFLATVLIFSGAIFRLLHWTFSEVLLLIGIVLLITWIALGFGKGSDNETS